MMTTTGFDPNDRLLVIVESAERLPASDMNGLSDPYIIVKLNDSFEKKTKIIKKNLNPIWNEEFLFMSLGGRDPLKIVFEVYDWDRFSKDDFLGSATLLIHSQKFDFNQIHQKCMNLTCQGSISIQYKIIRSEIRESGMFPVITELPSQTPQITTQHHSDATDNEKNTSFFNYEFSPMFRPSLPMNFKLLSVKKEKKIICQCDFQGPFEKPRNTIVKDPGVLQICYFNIPQDKFQQIHSEYITSYFDRLKHTTDIMNNEFKEIYEKDITSLFKKGNFARVLEHSCKANTTEGLMTIVTYSCLVGDSVMAIFRFVTYTYEPRLRNILLEIVKQSKITMTTTLSPSSPSSSSTSPSDSLLFSQSNSPSLTVSSTISSSSPSSLVEVGSLDSLIKENEEWLYSPSRLLSTHSNTKNRNSTSPHSPLKQ